MATWPVSKNVPRRIQWVPYSRNGQVANGVIAKRIADNLAHTVAWRRKSWHKCLDLTAIPSGKSGAGLEHWYFGIHTGEGVSELHSHVLLAASDNVSAAAPYVQVRAVDGWSGGSNHDSNKFYYGSVDAATLDGPGDLRIGRVVISVNPDTAYRVALKAWDYARPVAWALHEVAVVPIDDTTDGSVDPRVGPDNTVLDSVMSDHILAGTELWRNNSAPVLSWSQDAPDASGASGGGPTLSTSGTWTNIIDATTSVAASSVGAQLTLVAHNTTFRSTTPVLLAVKAQRTVGSGAATVRVTDGSNSVTVSGITTDAWYTASGTMPVTATQKWDIQASTAVGTTVRVDAVCVLEWE